MPPKPRAAAQSATTPAALAPAPPHLFLGTSGWAYPKWKPGFYPADVPAKRFLEHYATRLTSVEVNYTFSAELKPGQLEGWLSSVPEGFRFTFKAPQRITHFQRLLNSEETLSTFLGSLAPAANAKKLGAILFQLPPNFKALPANTERLTAFLKLPALRKHQIAFEFRHDSWFTDETYAVLRKHQAALCIAESEDLSTPDVSTATYSYFRLRMPGGYQPAQLKLFAQKFATHTSDTYIYLKHEDEPTGALNATAILSLLQQNEATA